MKKLFLMLVFFLTMVLTSSVYAEEFDVFVELPDGQKLSLDGLTGAQRDATIANLKKAAESKEVKETVVKVVMEKSPEELNKWRKLIVGTIKDVSTDLGIAANEFVRSPVGKGVVAIIIYKVAGKDLIHGLFQAGAAIGFWIVFVTLLGFTTKYFMGSKVVFTNRREIPQEKGKPIIELTVPKNVFTYPWSSTDARCALGVVLFAAFITISILCLLIVI